MRLTATAPVGGEKGRNTAKSGSGRFKAELTEIRLGGAKVLLVRPLTYMNLSGQAIGPLLAFYKLPVADLLVVCDDLSLPLGRLRLRASGSSGGQKGLQDIIRAAGVADVPRLRIRNWRNAPGVGDGRLRPEQVRPGGNADRGIGGRQRGGRCGVWVTAGIAAAMNQFNRA